MRNYEDGRRYAAQDEECHRHCHADQQDIQQVDLGFWWLSRLQRLNRQWTDQLRNGRLAKWDRMNAQD